jgi:hypothetical protein
MKVAVFEGHRYAGPSIPDDVRAPDFDHKLDASFGGMFGGTGPWYNENYELNRAVAPGEPLGSLPISVFYDARRWAFRHGSKAVDVRKGLKGGDLVQGNMATFDGANKLYTDGEATNPDFWFPTGSVFNATILDTWNYTKTNFPDKVKKGYRVP